MVGAIFFIWFSNWHHNDLRKVIDIVFLERSWRFLKGNQLEHLAAIFFVIALQGTSTLVSASNCSSCCLKQTTASASQPGQSFSTQFQPSCVAVWLIIKACCCWQWWQFPSNSNVSREAKLDKLTHIDAFWCQMCISAGSRHNVVISNYQTVKQGLSAPNRVFGCRFGEC